ncbi:MAG: hypothetical protein LUQ59_07040 [Methanothrix sp.]|nr:hypothetical protein [Methanothrix sp.]
MATVPALMGKPRRHLVKPAENCRDKVRKLELEVAKQILAEIFSARSSDVDDMIIRRLEDKREPGTEVQPKEALQTLERSAIKEKKGPVLWGSWPEMFQV